jgi:transcriptional regulator with XRE-family HTH domain
MFGERLKRARVKQGLSLELLANKADNIVTKQAISQYEKNQKNPSSTVLIALANALGVNVEYFFRNFTVQIGEVDFRKHFAFSKKRQEIIKEKVREYLERYIQIEEILEIKTPFVNPIKDDVLESMDDIEDIVMKLRQEWNLGFDPIYNVVEMLELKNIKVLLLDEEKKFSGLSGHANNDTSHQFIVLNRGLSDDKKRFTALHELAHLLLPQHKLNEEKASDRFAGAFAFPKESVIKEFGERRTKISFEELKHIKLKYGISIVGIVFRLYQLKIINKNMFERFLKQNRVTKFDNKVEFVRDERVTRFENLLAHAYSERLISLSKLAELLGERVDSALEKYGEMI